MNLPILSVCVCIPFEIVLNNLTTKQVTSTYSTYQISSSRLY
jgi:hypothetical protein